MVSYGSIWTPGHNGVQYKCIENVKAKWEKGYKIWS